MTIKISSAERKRAQDRVRYIEELCGAFSFRANISEPARDLLVQGVAHLLARQSRSKAPNRLQYLDCSAAFVDRWLTVCSAQGWEVELTMQAAWVFRGQLVDIIACTGVGATDSVPVVVGYLDERFALVTTRPRESMGASNPSLN